MNRRGGFETLLESIVPHATIASMSKASQLQARAATLSESMAAEVLDFLEFLTARKRQENAAASGDVRRFQGAFRGKLSSSDGFSARKSDDILLER